MARGCCFTRNLGTIVMDLDDVETLDHNALGGADTITVNDLSGTDSTTSISTSAGTLGGSTGDAAADTVIVNGTNGGDAIAVTLGSGGLTIHGLSAEVVVEHFELTDTVRIQGLGGTDVFDLTAIGAGGPFILAEGGAGDDVYKISSSFPSLSEGVDAGIDTVESSITHTLGANIENLNLTGSAAISGGGNELANVMIGNSAANSLSGAGGDDTLDGGGGDDSMSGGLGNDTYIVDSAADTTLEAAGGGTDLVQTSISYTLSASQEIENLTLTGSAAIDGTGNGLGNVITGNSAANTLAGGGGDDALNGGGGIDTASYAGAAAGVTVALGTTSAQNTVGDGTDTLSSIENLVGSSFADTLSGSAGENTISGGGDNDSVKGFAGNDMLNGDAGNDTLNGGASNDTLNGGDDDDTLIGQDGNDSLNGGNGIDTASYVGAVAGVTVALGSSGARRTRSATAPTRCLPSRTSSGRALPTRSAGTTGRQHPFGRRWR